MGPLLNIFIEGLIKAGKWLRIQLKIDKDKKPITLNSSNSNEILTGSMSVKGNNNTIIVIVSNSEGSSPRSEEAMRSAIKAAGDVVDGHEGNIIFEDDIPVYLDAPPFTEEQRLKLNQARKLGWSKEKRNALRFAFKLINLEDTKRCNEASEIFKSMMKSRKSELLRRMYNFSRSGYIDEFMTKAIFSPIDYNDSNMDKLLSYFPDAIWINSLTDFTSLEVELVRRAREGVKKLNVFARGKSNMNYLRDCIDTYLSDHLGTDSVVYVEEGSKDYTIGCTPGSIIKLTLVQLNEDIQRIIHRKEVEKNLERADTPSDEIGRSRFIRRLRKRSKKA
ncbi:MAG: hypothetical protein M1351_04705 [Candidatus Thermoplasmatota archaeon]|jgi:hypothetical protein|nr:hypothetical protein [Candidatus Thermoplasmatota archaeon]